MSKKKLAAMHGPLHDSFMHPLEKKILAILNTSGLFKPPGPTVVGVSGGPDSMALLHLLALVAPELELTAVYCDHGLRPEETPAEVTLVSERTKLLKAKFRVIPLTVRSWADEHGVSLEHAGHVLRYEAFDAVARDTAASWITVAHTADDQAEEVILRLLRGSGRKGLSGMLTLRDEKIVRPLLGVTKQEILAYLHSRGIPFLTDSSNEDRKFLRNKVRWELMPYLKDNFNPNIGETLRRTATILQDEEDLLEKLTITAITATVNFAKDKEGRPEAEVDIVTLNSYHPALQRRILENAILNLGSSPSFQLIENVRNLSFSAKKTATHLREGLRAERLEESIRLFWPVGRIRGRIPAPSWLPSDYQITLTAPGSINLPGFLLKLTVLSAVPPLASLSTWPADLLDADLASFPLTVRPPRHGDRFHPLGAPGSKKLADFLSDQKIPRQKRHTQPVLLVNNKIIALPGLRVDHNFRVTEASRRILEIRIIPLSMTDNDHTVGAV